MKKPILKLMLIMCAFILFWPSTVNGGVKVFYANKMNIQVQNINEKIKNIQLVVFNSNCNVCCNIS